MHEYRHLRGLKLADYHQDDAAIKIDILLGADHYYEFVTNVIRRGDAKTPVAVNSKLGWLLSGPMGGDNFTNTFVTTTHTLKCSETEIINPIHQLNDNMNKFWDFETIGIRNEESSVCERFLDDIIVRPSKFVLRSYHGNPTMDTTQIITTIHGEDCRHN